MHDSRFGKKRAPWRKTHLDSRIRAKRLDGMPCVRNGRFWDVRFVFSKLPIVESVGDEKGGETLHNSMSDAGCNPQPPRRPENSISPTVATGPQSVKRGENRARSESDGPLPGAGCYG